MLVLNKAFLSTFAVVQELLNFLLTELYNNVFVICLSQEGKKKFDKETEKYYTVLERHMASRKKEPFLQEVCPSYKKKQHLTVRLKMFPYIPL